MHSFKGQTVIVTGGTRGIGRSISEAFLKAGARVIVSYCSNTAAAEQFKKDNSKYKENIDIQKCDVSVYHMVEKFFEYINSKYDGFETLVNNAGIRKDALLALMQESDWHNVLNVNLDGVFYVCKFAIKSLIRNGYGRIINITSPSGKYGFKGQSNYAASKAGIVALTKALSKEVGYRGVTVNCISPGFIETELIQDLSEDLRNNYISRIPLKRFGKPDEVAACVLFLASKEASYINGSTLEVTGGL